MCILTISGGANRSPTLKFGPTHISYIENEEKKEKKPSPSKVCPTLKKWARFATGHYI
jgi:hypothetical protein